MEAEDEDDYPDIDPTLNPMSEFDDNLMHMEELFPTGLYWILIDRETVCPILYLSLKYYWLCHAHMFSRLCLQFVNKKTLDIIYFFEILVAIYNIKSQISDKVAYSCFIISP